MDWEVGVVSVYDHTVTDIEGGEIVEITGVGEIFSKDMGSSHVDVVDDLVEVGARETVVEDRNFGVLEEICTYLGEILVGDHRDDY